MKLTPSLRKDVMNGMSNQDLVDFYKSVTNDKERMVLWSELNPQQQQAIVSAAEMHKRQKALENLKGNSRFNKRK